MISIKASTDGVGGLLVFVAVVSEEAVGIEDCSVAVFGVQAVKSQKNKRNLAGFCMFILCVFRSQRCF